MLYLDEDKKYIRYHKLPNEELCEQSGLDFDQILLSTDSDITNNSSTAIAAAITYWARIIMYPFIINSHYTDTDSVFLKSELPESIVGTGLGKFKRVHGLISPSKKKIFIFSGGLLPWRSGGQKKNF